jgi:hypothetical protein
MPLLASAPSSYRRSQILECVEGCLHLGQIQVTSNEDDPAAAVVVWPLSQVPGGVDDMLHAFDE